MKPSFLFAAGVTGSFVLAACAEDKPAPVVHETRTVHHYHPEKRANPPVNNASDFEPVARPATYSR